MKKVDIEGGKLIIIFKFEYSENDLFQSTLKTVQGLKDRVFKSLSKHWEAPDTPENRAILEAAGFEFSGRLKVQERVRYNLPPEPITVMIDNERIKPLIPLLSGLKPYQMKGVAFVEDCGGKAFIADEMGLGKTIQAIGYLKIHPEAFPALIVCPSAVKPQWRQEIRKWIGTKHTLEILEGETPTLHNFCDFTIINYEILNYWLPALEVAGFKCIIGDEIQKIANPEAKRAQAFIQLAAPIPSCILLSGTPIKNRTKEFYNALSMVDPETFKSRYTYMHRYCDPKLKSVPKKGGGFMSIWTFDGCTNWEELHQKISKVVIRRTKAEVLPELPKKIKCIIPLASEKKAFNEYLEAESTFKTWVERDKEADRTQTKLHIEHLKQLAYLCKRNAAINWINDYLDSDEKLVVITHHKAVIADLEQAFRGRCVTVDGSTKDKEAQKEKFWKDPSIKIFIGQYQAAGVGLNLQCASAVCFVEFPWTPGDAAQCEDRVHRMGQTASSVYAYYLIAEGTIDLRVAELLISKNKDAQKVLDGKEGTGFFGDNEILSELLKEE